MNTSIPASDNRPPMLSVDEALAFLLDAADRRLEPSWVPETVSTLAANGRILAVDQTSTLNVPSMDNSQMDGYAVRADDCANGMARMAVSQRIAAGQVGTALSPGTVARIFTGATMPPGADAVVMQEHCQSERLDDLEYVTITHAPVSGEWIRRIGEDIRVGELILSRGTMLRPQELGLAASVGLASLPVWPKLRVALFFTGDELAMPGETLKPGAIYNSSRFTLRGLLENLGCVITDYGIVADTLTATRETLRLAATGHDLIITSGGVSVGEEDHVKPAVEAEGRLTMWQIAVKPGKPLAFGEIDRDRSGTARDSGPSPFFIGLPGNPVSSFVTFLLFVRPFILRLQGACDVLPRAFMMRADFTLQKADRRNEFLRARINTDGGLDLYENQGSAVLTSAVWADGLIDNPAGNGIHTGDLVKFIPFSGLND